MNRTISAVFDSRADAEAALTDLRAAGVSDSAISVISQNDSGAATTSDTSGYVTETHGDSSGVAKGMGVGAGVGALFGLAALAIPGIGPFVAAGALAQTLGAAGGAVAAGAIVGGTAGGLTSALVDNGVSENDARYYEDRVGQGGILVAVDPTSAGASEETIGDILYRAGGHSASRSRMTA